MGLAIMEELKYCFNNVSEELLMSAILHESRRF